MSTTLITNLAEVFTADAQHTRINNAAILIEDETISWIGAAADAPAADHVIDAQRRAALPGWVDSHTHLVFAGDRSAEFVARMAGQEYAAGGIAVTTAATRSASDYDLTRLLLGRAAEALAGGTTFLETKTGYGLGVEEEARHARIASTVVDRVTFLGAHLVPAGTDAQEYTDLVCGEMLQRVAPYVHFADVFCERGAFNE
ncbi:MAG: imidazolonepropionase, partial [Paeniglutamicibacter terrestris]